MQEGRRTEEWTDGYAQMVPLLLLADQGPEEDALIIEGLYT